jgi:hypothetical protein
MFRGVSVAVFEGQNRSALVVEIEFYLEYWEEREQWPPRVDDALLDFLAVLQNNPDSPSIKICIHWSGRGYVVWWRVKREKAEVEGIWTHRPMLIRVLAIERM